MSNCDCDACTGNYDEDDYTPSMCDECGNEQDDCECCSDCGYSSCICDDDCEDGGGDGMGHSDTPPWETRLGIGPIVTKAFRDKSWKEVWPEVDDQIDPIQEASSFYLLEGISANAVFPSINVKAFTAPSAEVDKEFLKIIGLTRLQAKHIFDARDALIADKLKDPSVKMHDLSIRASEELEALVEKLDPILVNYTHLACAGEVRHHRAFSDRRNTLHSNRETAWVDWRTIYETVGVEAIMDMHSLFLEFSGDAYGGPKWAMACKVLYQRLTGKLGPNEKINKKIFVDRVWTLEHNGGCLLNKISWAVKNGRHWSLSQIKTVLDAHANDDWMSLYRTSAPSVQALFRKYVILASEVLGSDKPAWMDKIVAIKANTKAEQNGVTEILGGFTGPIPANATVRWDFSYRIRSTGRGWVKGSVDNIGKTTYLVDFMANPKKFSLKQYGKKSGPVGEIREVDWTFTGYVYDENGYSCFGRWVTRVNHEEYYDDHSGDVNYTAIYETPIVALVPEGTADYIEKDGAKPKPKLDKYGFNIDDKYNMELQKAYKDLYSKPILAKPLLAKKAPKLVAKKPSAGVVKAGPADYWTDAIEFNGWVDSVVIDGQGTLEQEIQAAKLKQEESEIKFKMDAQEIQIILDQFSKVKNSAVMIDSFTKLMKNNT